jgi:hypothetical protein
MLKCDNNLRHVPKHDLLRRLSVLREPGNKNRLITLADFWSQNALLPLHNELMSILKKIPQDCTYSASEAMGKIQRLSYGKDVACFDLKEFTNLLPLSLQKRVLLELTQDEGLVND